MSRPLRRCELDSRQLGTVADSKFDVWTRSMQSCAGCCLRSLRLLSWRRRWIYRPRSLWLVNSFVNTARVRYLPLQLTLLWTPCVFSAAPYIRVVHGSILCDLIKPNPSADWPNTTQPTASGKIWTQPDPTQQKLKNLNPTQPYTWTTLSYTAARPEADGSYS